MGFNPFVRRSYSFTTLNCLSLVYSALFSQQIFNQNEKQFLKRNCHMDFKPKKGKKKNCVYNWNTFRKIVVQKCYFKNTFDNGEEYLKSLSQWVRYQHI